VTQVAASRGGHLRADDENGRRPSADAGRSHAVAQRSSLRPAPWP